MNVLCLFYFGGAVSFCKVGGGVGGACVVVMVREGGNIWREIGTIDCRVGVKGRDGWAWRCLDLLVDS